LTIRIGWNSRPLGRSEALALEPLPLKSPIGAESVADWVANTYMIRAPFDLQMAIRIEAERLHMEWVGPSPDLDPNEVFTVTQRDMWAAPDHPTVQMTLNNLFVADEPVWMETFPPCMHRQSPEWPGVMIPGRLDIHRWTRPVQWVFEWHDLSRPLSLRRGQIIKYVRFMRPGPQATFSVEPVPYTEELRKAVDRCGRIAMFSRNALSYRDAAMARRPARWLPRRGPLTWLLGGSGR
jgi:hypothetical protein